MYASVGTIDRIFCVCILFTSTDRAPTLQKTRLLIRSVVQERKGIKTPRNTNCERTSQSKAKRNNTINPFQYEKCRRKKKIKRRQKRAKGRANHVLIRTSDAQWRGTFARKRNETSYSRSTSPANLWLGTLASIAFTHREIITRLTTIETGVRGLLDSYVIFS